MLGTHFVLSEWMNVWENTATVFVSQKIIVSLFMAQPFLSLLKKMFFSFALCKENLDFIMKNFSSLILYQFFSPTIPKYLNFSDCVRLWPVGTPWMSLPPPTPMYHTSFLSSYELGWHYLSWSSPAQWSCPSTAHQIWSLYPVPIHLAHSLFLWLYYTKPMFVIIC